MQKMILYRKRLIPEECVLLKDDIILERNDSIIITKWNTLKPKHDLHHGYSCYFLDKGYKVSKFLREDGSLLYWYCDIVDYSFSADGNELTVTDCLADIVIMPDGFVKVLDLDELSEALKKGLLSAEMLQNSLVHTNDLLQLIYHNQFSTLTSKIESFE